jgi:hypothetical protein
MRWMSASRRGKCQPTRKRNNKDKEREKGERTSSGNEFTRLSDDCELGHLENFAYLCCSSDLGVGDCPSLNDVVDVCKRKEGKEDPGERSDE